MIEIVAIIVWFGTEHYKKDIYEICLNTYVQQVQEVCEWLTVIENHERTKTFFKKQILEWNDVEINTYHVHNLEQRIEELWFNIILSFYMLQK